MQYYANYFYFFHKLGTSGFSTSSTREALYGMLQKSSNLVNAHVSWPAITPFLMGPVPRVSGCEGLIGLSQDVLGFFLVGGVELIQLEGRLELGLTRLFLTGGHER